MTAKSHHTAVVVIPPQDLWEPIQAIRRLHDRQFARWMPHINLLYPFAPFNGWDGVLPALATACATLEPFAVQLTTFRYFTHPSGRVTLYLALEPGEPVVRLQHALHAVCPAFDDLSRFAGGFTPHLSVGQAQSVRAAENLVSQWQATWRSLAFAVSIVSVIRRPADVPFVIERVLPLGRLRDGK